MKKKLSKEVIAVAIIFGAAQAAGINFKKIREDLGYSQELIGRMTGFGRSFISRFENGSAKAGYDTLLILAAAVNVSVVKILDHVLFTGINCLNEEAICGNNS